MRYYYATGSYWNRRHSIRCFVGSHKIDRAALAGFFVGTVVTSHCARCRKVFTTTYYGVKLDSHGKI